MVKMLLIIGAGSFLGGVLRFLIGSGVQHSVLSSFPFGTFLVNIIGCLLIGVFYGLSERGNIMSAEWRMFLTVGFCGGFTTFSTFANENLTLLRNKEFLYFALYAGLSVFLGILATYLGILLIKIMGF